MRTFAAAALLLLTSGSVSAQFTVGITGGPNNSTWSGDAPDDARYRSKSSLLAGVILEYEIAKDTRVSFQPSLSTSGAGIAFDIPGTEESRDSIDIDLSYLHLPLLARVVTSGGRWYVTGGPYLGVLQSADGTREGEDDVTDISDDLLSYDIGALFGIGHMFPVNPLKLYVEVRWVQGLTSIIDRGTDERLWNTGRQIHFGLLYTIGS